MSKPIIFFAARSTKAQEMFGGKTLAEIGREYDLSDEDVRFILIGSKNEYDISGHEYDLSNDDQTFNPSTNGRKYIVLIIGEVRYQIPFSKSAGVYIIKHLIEEPNLIHWQFHVTEISTNRSDGRSTMERYKDFLANCDASSDEFGYEYQGSGEYDLWEDGGEDASTYNDDSIDKKSNYMCFGRPRITIIRFTPAVP